MFLCQWLSIGFKRHAEREDIHVLDTRTVVEFFHQMRDLRMNVSLIASSVELPGQTMQMLPFGVKYLALQALTHEEIYEIIERRTKQAKLNQKITRDFLDQLFSRQVQFGQLSPRFVIDLLTGILRKIILTEP